MPNCYALKTFMPDAVPAPLAYEIYRFSNRIARDLFVKQFRLIQEFSVKSIKRKHLEEQFGIYRRDKLNREFFGTKLIIDGGLK